MSSEAHIEPSTTAVPAQDWSIHTIQLAPIKPSKVELYICEICGKPTGITVTPDWWNNPKVSFHVHDECIGQLARKYPEYFTVDSPGWKAEHPE